MARIPVVCLVALALLLTSTALAKDSSDDEILACVKNRNKKLRIVGTPSKCKSGKKIVSWNATGPGAAGSTGVSGSEGRSGIARAEG